MTEHSEVHFNTKVSICYFEDARMLYWYCPLAKIIYTDYNENIIYYSKY